MLFRSEALRLRIEEQHGELVADFAILSNGLARQMDEVKAQKYSGKASIFGQTVTFTMEPKS